MSASREDVPEDNQAFLDAVSIEDELGAVIRGHLYVEAALEGFIHSCVVNAKAFEKVQLTYVERVHLAVAMGLTPDLSAPLLLLGTIRNTFAHKLDASITKSRMDAMRSSFSPDHRSLLHAAFLTTREKASVQAKNLKDLVPRDQFTLIVIALRNCLLIATSQ